MDVKSFFGDGQVPYRVPVVPAVGPQSSPEQAPTVRQVGGREPQGDDRMRTDGYFKKRVKKMLQRQNGTL